MNLLYNAFEVNIMSKTFLGSKIDLKASNSIKSALDSAFGSNQNLFVSQISDLAGIDSTTIQNWVKRDFVSNPKGKKYNREQTIKIFLLNALRGSLALEKASALIEKAVLNASISYEALFSCLGAVLIRADSFNIVDQNGLEGIIDDELYSLDLKNEFVAKALLVMTLACLSSSLKANAEDILGQI